MTVLELIDKLKDEVDAGNGHLHVVFGSDESELCIGVTNTLDEDDRGPDEHRVVLI